MRAITLLFHDVVPEGRWALSGFQGADADVYKLDCREFHRHLDAVARTLRERPVTASELSVQTSADRPVLLTFDDGGVSAVLYVADMLDEFGWKAHFLITTGRIGAPGFLGCPQIRDLRRRGHIIGSHSHTHPTRMALCSAAELRDEWDRSVRSLADILGEPVEVASVPGGYYSRQIAVAAAKAGINVLFNSEPVTRAQSIDGCTVLGRFTIRRGYPPGRSAAIAVAGRRFRTREYLFWEAKKIGKAVLGGAWLRARIVLLERRAASSRHVEVDSSGEVPSARPIGGPGLPKARTAAAGNMSGSEAQAQSSEERR